MRTRRGSTYWTSTMSGHLDAFQVGDIVTSVVVAQDSFIGSVRFVDHKCNKVLVAWGGGSLSQHDPEEIQLSVHQTDVLKSRMASRRGITGMGPEEANDDPQFVGDPKVHGLDKPRGGGFSIMQNLVTDLREEALDEASENPKVTDIHGSTTAGLKSRRAGSRRDKQKQEWMKDMHEEVQRAVPGVDANLPHDYWDTATHLFFQGEDPKGAAGKMLRSIKSSDSGLKSRRAMYHCGPDRTYRLTKSEQEAGSAQCPKCRAPMNQHKFIRGNDILMCEGCGFKVTKDKTTTDRPVPVVEAVPSEEAVVATTTTTELKSRSY